MNIPPILQICLGFLAIWLSALASFSVPGSAVPVSMQTLAVVIVGAVLGPRRAAAAVGVYLILGAIGLPVFASGKGGGEVLMGPTGGFLFAFWIIAIGVGLFWQKFQHKNGLFPWIILIMAHTCILIGGFIWLAFYTGKWNFPTDTLSKLAPGLGFKIFVGGLILWLYRKFVELKQ